MDKADFWMLFRETGVPEYYLAFRRNETEDSHLL